MQIDFNHRRRLVYDSDTPQFALKPVWNILGEIEN